MYLKTHTILFTQKIQWLLRSLQTLLLALTVLLCNSLAITVVANSIHHAPAPAPIIYKSPPPSPPPPHHYAPPPHAPVYPPHGRKQVAVQGVVYCKSCKYKGIDTLLGASPHTGAVVKLQCNSSRHGVFEETKTDKNGYFFLKPPKLSTSGVHKCKVFIVSSPLPKCGVPTNLHGGASGAILTPPIKNKDDLKLPFVLYTVGPFAFEPSKKLPCHY